MKLVVTGGAGFIGSHLVDELARFHEVAIIDDISTGRIENISRLEGKDNVTFVKDSILNLDVLNEMFSGVDYVFHQAAIPSVTRSIQDPLLVNDVNIRGTLNVLIAARNNHVRKVMVASSSSVYGDTAVLPKVETMVPSPQSPYALTKMVGEYYCQLFDRIYHLPTVCLRYFNVYGPRQNPHSQYSAVIPKFITQIKMGLPPTIYGDGNQTRDFTYVKDVVRANVLAAESDANGVFNIGSGSRISVLELAKDIMKKMGKVMQPEFKESRTGDVRDSLASIEKAASFGYKPLFKLADGLQETIRGLLDEK